MLKCSELIELLKTVIAEHGDLQVGCLNHEYGWSHEAAFEVVKSTAHSAGYKNLEDDHSLGPKFLRVS